MPAKTLTLTEVAGHIGVTRQTLYNMIENKTFPVKPIKGTRPRRWNIDAIDRWLNK